VGANAQERVAPLSRYTDDDMILPAMILPAVRRSCFCLAVALSGLLSLGWSPTGHMVVDQIAKERRGGNAECGLRNAE